ncbi:DinB family protein [Priestia megaterium]|uniref:DinB family protein n=1 Tax=Priestia megaterium (strain DSM 319 / IMG 1521) TaxID=592022 RepID=D5DEN9_PRIM3|nr:DinB family protein [Priestia megaterium]ADF39321.1 DinB family protein [Priestia megaterium DSM 319]MED3939951.1 DinB family protein [Priestia megaterium]MED4217989.1 DinB family protein [Priestia megaterium]WEZ38479.1 DinB family protein [Priestia megaterium DSM 319]
MEKLEYEWVKQTRQILLDQCKELNKDDFTKEFEFGFKSIRDSLVHASGCYHAWLGSFVLSETSSPLLTKEIVNNMQVDDIQRYFEQADRYVEKVLEQFTDKFDKPIEKELAWRANSGLIRKTPRQLLVHSITHESHHKGQIVAMLRLLGHTPKNTDILGLPAKELTK